MINWLDGGLCVWRYRRNLGRWVNGWSFQAFLKVGKCDQHLLTVPSSASQTPFAIRGATYRVRDVPFLSGTQGLSNRF